MIVKVEKTENPQAVQTPECLPTEQEGKTLPLSKYTSKGNFDFGKVSGETEAEKEKNMAEIYEFFLQAAEPLSKAYPMYTDFLNFNPHQRA